MRRTWTERLRTILAPETRSSREERPRSVASVMTRGVRTCRAEESLNAAARIMWDADCGAVPVVDDGGKLVGMITDRDICMAAFTREQPLSQMSIGSVCARGVVAVRESDDLEAVEREMRRHQVRRVPVQDAEGRLVGIVSLADFARAASPERTAVTLQAVSARRPRAN